MADTRELQWKLLSDTLAYLTNAQFCYEKTEPIDGLMWINDARRALGSLALLLAEGPDAEAYARLLESVLTPPSSTAEKAYIERNGRDQS